MVINTPAILILLLSFLAMILLRFPIAYSVALSSIFCLMYQGLSLATVCQQMVKGISSYSLMAVPFFITMGMLMGSGGLSDKLVALANALRQLDAGAAWAWSTCWIPTSSAAFPVPPPPTPLRWAPS